MKNSKYWSKAFIFCESMLFDRVITNILSPRCQASRNSQWIGNYFFFLSDERGPHIIIFYEIIGQVSKFNQALSASCSSFFAEIKQTKRRAFRQTLATGSIFNDFPKYKLLYIKNIDLSFEYVHLLAEDQALFLFRLQTIIIGSTPHQEYINEEAFLSVLNICWRIFPKKTALEAPLFSAADEKLLREDFSRHELFLLDHFSRRLDSRGLWNRNLRSDVFLTSHGNLELVVRFISDIYGVKFVSHVLYFFCRLCRGLSF